jgi:3-hydroxyisobutyrate dehydrogenase
VGFVGLGMMGAPMVRRLADAGHSVTVYDAVTERARQIARGANIHAASGLGSVAKDAEVVILMLPDSDRVDQVVISGGLLDRLAAGCLLVDMGSSNPLRTRNLAERAKARGVNFIDAPVSGGTFGAESGTLTIMVGGDADTISIAQPIFDALCSQVRHAGSVGAGHAAKALNNLMNGANLIISAEAVIAGQQFGVDPATLIDIVNMSSGRSAATESKWPKFILPRTFDSGFALRLMLKDMRTALDLIDSAGTPSGVSVAAVAAWASADELLRPGVDNTEIVTWVESGVRKPGL